MYPEDYLSNAMDFLLIRLCDVEDATVGQGYGCSSLQHGLDCSLPHSIFYTRHLAVHWTTCYNTNLNKHTYNDKATSLQGLLILY